MLAGVIVHFSLIITLEYNLFFPVASAQKGEVFISKYLLRSQLRPRVIGGTAEIQTLLYFNPRRSRKFGQKRLLTLLEAKLVAAAGVKVEQSFNFGRAAMRPQFGCKWPQP